VKRGLDRLLTGLIVALAGALAWVVYPTLEQKVVNAGDAAPEFRVVTDGGKALTRSDFGGKLLVLNFWASWCAPCVDEAPSMEAFHREMASQGVVVLGVSIDRNEKMYRRFLKDFRITFATARDPDWDINTRYGTFQFPETYIIDSQGTVREKIISAQNWMDPAFLARVRGML
jgi:peroxiredoxin